MTLEEKLYEQGLRTLTVQVKGPGSGRETALDLSNQEDLKFYLLETQRQCHTTGQGHLKEGEYKCKQHQM